MHVSENTPSHDQIFDELLEEIAQIIGVSVKNLPGDVSANIASEFLSVSEQTLAIWRTTGRYNLPYFKVGRYVKYGVRILVRHKLACLH